MRAKTTKGDVIHGPATMALTGHSLSFIEIDGNDLEALSSLPAEDLKQWVGHKLTRFPPQRGHTFPKNRVLENKK